MRAKRKDEGKKKIVKDKKVRGKTIREGDYLEGREQDPWTSSVNIKGELEILIIIYL